MYTLKFFAITLVSAYLAFTLLLLGESLNTLVNLLN